MQQSSGAATSVAPHAHSRLLALDVFRGITVAGMLLVNSPGSWSAIYAPLRHAPWHGWTAADLVFPFFLFIVGVTTQISVSAARARGDSEKQIVLRILRRGALITVIGLLVSAFPYYPLERITTMRIPGVLQRIGVAYTLAALITLRGGTRSHIAAAGAILLGYWFVMTRIPVPGLPEGVRPLDAPATTLAAWVDRALLDGHLWAGSVTWDPEGVLSTIPAVATVILGVLAARLLFGDRRNPTRRGADATDTPGTAHAADAKRVVAPPVQVHRMKQLALAGALLFAAGLAWGTVFPINKNIWTSSYVLVTGGLAAISLAACLWLVDIARVRWFTYPFLVFGRNPLLAFVGSMVMARTIYSLVRVSHDGGSVPLQTFLYREYFASWLQPQNASLLFAVSYLLLWFGILVLLDRRNIVVKV